MHREGRHRREVLGVAWGACLMAHRLCLLQGTAVSKGGWVGGTHLAGGLPAFTHSSVVQN